MSENETCPKCGFVSEHPKIHHENSPHCLRRQLVQAKARIAGLEATVQEFQIASGLNTSSGDPDGITPAHVEAGICSLRAIIDKLRQETSLFDTERQAWDSTLGGQQDDIAELSAVVDKLHAWIRKDVPAELYGLLAEQCRNNSHAPCYCGCHKSVVTNSIREAAEAAKEKP